MKKNATEIQADYYKQTADKYDASHLDSTAEHDVALHFLSSVIKLYHIKSILDVGAGTGRAIDFIIKNHPDIKVIGIDPVKELLEQGHSKGIPKNVLIEGDGNKINFGDAEFDLVCEFGILHHVSKPDVVVAEMLRVAKKAVFISDSNNFGQGGRLGRYLKQTLNFWGLWRAYDLIRTKGKGYQISEGDGLYYSYSVFNNYKQIKKQCRKIQLLNTNDGEMDLYKTASHIALLGLK
ncbi:class I SAM-dependent methyltransferase [Mucilaginibacter sp. X4EP1]|uniref:class I SAM-dependent methyltransferase n=1 Tax=Mucilaginibacter sp. X4EP1 TaxID=2723092 RepID=UPI002167E94D|nr:class I SAM-dependent methyltransferase [Mucilaginibacter sp. X4EP1]MCS3812378.1 ubiquinone/menaquinone biosynthesis C-methylase UbiE [Mucilaginibacter sp. X4EP1]